MGMKPRIEQANKQIDPKLVTAPCRHPDAETDSNIANTVTTQKVETNHKIAPNVVTGPKSHE